MNRSGIPNRTSWAELRQKGLEGTWRYDTVEHCDEEFHMVQVLDVHCNVQVGDIIHHENFSWEICKIWYAYEVDGRSILLYAHPTKAEIHPMTEDEWHELYGHMDLASRS